MKNTLLTLALVVGPALAFAAEPKTQLTQKDMEALIKLHQTNQMEIEMGKLAKKNGGSKQVKSFGDVLIKDHSMADKHIVAFSKKYGVDLTMSSKDEADKAEQQSQNDMMKRMETMKGEEFDREFAKMMVDGHQTTINLVQTTLTTTQDQPLQNLLNKLLPVLQEHLKLAQNIADTTKAS
jgi:putative membrane protein